MNLDAAWTDAVLATASLGSAAWGLSRDRTRWITPLGLAVLGVAASVGTGRFFGVDALIGTHDALSRWAGLAGLPLAAAGILARDLAPERRRLAGGAALGLLVVGLGLALALPADAVRPVRTAVSGLLMVGCLGAGLWRWDALAVLAPTLVLVAGLGIAGDGELAGFHRMGWFHLVLAAAAACFARAALPRD